MRTRPRLPYVLALFLAVSLASRAEEVTLQHRGLDLNANLALAESKGLSDGVLLMVHGTLAHNRMEIIRELEQWLKDVLR